MDCSIQKWRWSFALYGCATLLATFAMSAETAYSQQTSLAQAFNYGVTSEDDIKLAATTEISTICCEEPSCEAAIECGSAAGCGDACGCGCPACEAKKGKPSPCASSHKGVFYANDFSYLKDPGYNGCCLGDGLKLMPVDRCGRFGTLDVGGQLRLRYHHEEGMGQEPASTRFMDTENDFLLTRLRLYTNWKVNDAVRFYCEGIYAETSGSDDYVTRPIDLNYGDILNLFVDLKLTDTTTVRVGRQELVYGAQRTVSPLDWANTRRTFEGAKIMYKDGDLAIDGFFTNFVRIDANDFDEADYDTRFYGVYGVYSGLEDATLDFYYLGYDDDRALGASPVGASDFSLHTVGLRLNGSHCDWLYEFEGAPQFGRQSGGGLDHTGGFATAGIGRKLDMAWSPTVWLYYDYASGNNLGGDYNRYNQLFPLAHKYLGFIDATQRANIESPNILLTMNPKKDVKLLLWYYHFMANQDTDLVPSVGGTPAQSNASKDWGDELDMILSYNITPRSDILFGYSHFWAGNKIQPLGGANDADFFYTQWTLNF